MKKFLLGLFVGFVGFVSFLNAGLIDYNTSVSIAKNSQLNTTTGDCFIQGSNQYRTRYVENGVETQIAADKVYCFTGNGYVKNNSTNTAMTVSKFNIKSLYPECPTCEICEECEECPAVDTGAILSGYIAVSDVTINYCVSNDLCPTSSGSRSELMINNIVHEGRPLINLNIPDYIQWDYTVDENQYDIYVGSGYDQDYIDSVLKINSYRPDSEDFTNIFVSGLTLIFPYIFVALLIVFMWKLLKRVFK